MRIAIIGGGFFGLTIGLFLSKNNVKILKIKKIFLMELHSQTNLDFIMAIIQDHKKL